MSGVCAASDIWSVGCTVIELLTCKPPYYDLQPMPALFRIVQVFFPSAFSPSYHPFILRGMNKNAYCSHVLYFYFLFLGCYCHFPSFCCFSGIISFSFFCCSHFHFPFSVIGPSLFLFVLFTGMPSYLMFRSVSITGVYETVHNG